MPNKILFSLCQLLGSQKIKAKCNNSKKLSVLEDVTFLEVKSKE